MRTTETVIIGAGQAGLALSYILTATGHPHVLLDRGRLAERWRSERWDSLRLLTPNWMTRLPGWWYAGADPDGYMTAPALVAYLEHYAASFGAPVEEDVTVEAVERSVDGYHVATSGGSWRCRAVVIATGAADIPHIPTLAAGLPVGVEQLASARYRNPESLADGGVLVVGASASGLQIADELARAGRRVVLAVGNHNRMPRCYRGRDVMWWLERSGALDQRIYEVPDPAASRRAPSMQLVGRPDHADLDLGVVQKHGVELTGRLIEAGGGAVRFADDLHQTTAKAEARLHRVLDRIDRTVDDAGWTDRVPGGRHPAPMTVPASPDRLHLGATGITSVIWATGHRQAYPWLQVPGVDADTGLRHSYGAVHGADGLYVLGLRFQTRRNSNFIDGVGHDARLVADQILCRRAHTSHIVTDIAARTA